MLAVVHSDPLFEEFEIFGVQVKVVSGRRTSMEDAGLTLVIHDGTKVLDPLKAWW